MIIQQHKIQQASSKSDIYIYIWNIACIEINIYYCEIETNYIRIIICMEIANNDCEVLTNYSSHIENSHLLFIIYKPIIINLDTFKLLTNRNLR